MDLSPGHLAGVLTGPSTRTNAGAADHHAGLLAYGAGPSICVLEVESMQLINSLTGGHDDSPVSSVRWCPERISRDVDQPSCLKLASADVSGRVVIWDVNTCRQLRVFGGAPSTARGQAPAEAAPAGSAFRAGSVIDMQWVSHGPMLLAVAAFPNVLTIWDAEGGRPLWRRDGGSEPVTFVRCDPLDRRRLCVAGYRGTVALITLKDVTSQQGVEVQQYRVASGAPDNRPDSSRLCCLFPKARQMLYLMLPREIISFDMEFGMPVANTAIPRANYAPFTDVLPDADENCLLCTHADGALTVWVRKPGTQTYKILFKDALVPANSAGAPPVLMAAVACADGASARKCILSVLDDGRCIRWALPDIEAAAPTAFLSVPAPAPTPAGARPALVVAGSPPPPGPALQLVGVACYSGLSGAVTCLATGPFLGSRAHCGRAPPPALAAVGTASGSIELVDLGALSVGVTLQVHAAAVRGIAWLGCDVLVSYSAEPTMGGTGYRNALVITDLLTGCARPLQRSVSKERGAQAASEPQPIRAVRAHAAGGLFAVLLRGTVEVWSVPHGPGVPRGAAPALIGSLNLGITELEWLAPWPAPRAVDGTDPEAGAAFLFGTSDGKLGSVAVEGTWHGGRRLEDKAVQRPADLGADFVATALATRGALVVAGDDRGTLRCWNSVTGWCAAYTIGRGPIRRVALAPTLSTGTEGPYGRAVLLFGDGSLAAWSLDSGEAVAPPGAITALTLPPGVRAGDAGWAPMMGASGARGSLLAVAGTDGALHVCDARVIAPLGPPRAASERPPPSLGFLFRPRPAVLAASPLLPRPLALLLRLLVQQGAGDAQFGPDAAPREAPFAPDGRVAGAATNDMASTGGDATMASSLLRLLPIHDDGTAPSKSRAAAERLSALATLMGHWRAGASAAARWGGEDAVIATGAPGDPASVAAGRMARAAAAAGDAAESHFWRALPTLLRDGVALAIAAADNSAQGAAAAAFSVGGSDVGSSLSPSLPQATLPSTNTLAVSPAAAATAKRLAYDPTSAATAVVTGSLWNAKSAALAALERVRWHERLSGGDSLEKRVQEYAALGDNEAAVALLLATPADSPGFYRDALRAVALASATGRTMLDQTVKVIASHAGSRGDVFTSSQMLCGVGRYGAACVLLQDASRWEDAAGMAAAHLEGLERAKVLMRWADHVLEHEGDLWRAVALFVAAGALRSALSTLWEAGLPDAAAAFAAACREAGGVTDAGAGEEGSAELQRDAVDLGWGRLVDADIQASCAQLGSYVSRLVTAAIA